LGIAITPDGRYAYVVNADPYAIAVFDTIKNTVVATVKAGTFLNGVVMGPAPGR
jgi:YVTN family beta-propeller protein